MVDYADAKTLALDLLRFLPPDITEAQVAAVGAMLAGMALGNALANGHLANGLEPAIATSTALMRVVAIEVAAA